MRMMMKMTTMAEFLFSPRQEEQPSLGKPQELGQSLPLGGKPSLKNIYMCIQCILYYTNIYNVYNYYTYISYVYTMYRNAYTVNE